MKTVAASCPFVPCELIAACGHRPLRLAPSITSVDAAGSPAGLCRYAEALATEAARDDRVDALVLSTVCDQMRRVADVTDLAGKPVFLLNVPTTWQSPEVWKLYEDELARLSRFLQRIGGQALDMAKLAAVMKEYDVRRNRLRGLAGTMSARQFAEAVLALPSPDAAAMDVAESPPPNAHGIPLAVIGGELFREDLALLEDIEAAGGRIVVNATDAGMRSLPAPFDGRSLSDEPLAELARAYFGTIPHAFRRPNSGLYEYLAEQIAEHGMRGLIFRRYPWCDTWNAELPRLREWADLPVLDLDMGSERGTHERFINRLQAFMEAVQ
ncbi:MAG: 2-hydroxyacyl-CoA dehydratase [Planctomycetota bacterium]|jgi:benzoyl-CoA reductase/2-hydroxyglutaryl-CoA dehydratase subunit BcrC/BadD/HgdB